MQSAHCSRRRRALFCPAVEEEALPLQFIGGCRVMTMAVQINMNSLIILERAVDSILFFVLGRFVEEDELFQDSLTPFDFGSRRTA